jgi:glutamate mutase epsilon subunit
MATSYAVFTWGSTAAYMYSPTRKIADELHEKNSVIDTNILVENFGNKTKVRMVLVQKILQNAEGFSYTKSATLRAIRIYNPKVYEEFFNQINDKL